MIRKKKIEINPIHVKIVHGILHKRFPHLTYTELIDVIFEILRALPKYKP